MVSNREREVEIERERERERETPSSSSEQQTPTISRPENKPAKENNSKSLANKLSVHQLIAEAMPSLQMSVQPVYFYNKATRSLVAIPYLVMKSISKMPLLPGMLESGLSPLTPSSMNSNSLNLVHSPLNQRLRSRPLSHLSPLLGDDSASYTKHNLIESESSNTGHSWLSLNGNGQQYTSTSYWK